MTALWGDPSPGQRMEHGQLQDTTVLRQTLPELLRAAQSVTEHSLCVCTEAAPPAHLGREAEEALGPGMLLQKQPSTSPSKSRH